MSAMTFFQRYPKKELKEKLEKQLKMGLNSLFKKKEEQLIVLDVIVNKPADIEKYLKKFPTMQNLDAAQLKEFKDKIMQIHINIQVNVNFEYLESEKKFIEELSHAGREVEEQFESLYHSVFEEVYNNLATEKPTVDSSPILSLSESEKDFIVALSRKGKSLFSVLGLQDPLKLNIEFDSEALKTLKKEVQIRGSQLKKDFIKPPTREQDFAVELLTNKTTAVVEFLKNTAKADDIINHMLKPTQPKISARNETSAPRRQDSKLRSDRPIAKSKDSEGRSDRSMISQQETKLRPDRPIAKQQERRLHADISNAERQETIRLQGNKPRTDAPKQARPSQPVASHPKPVARQSQPAASHSQQVAPRAQPAVQRAEPVNRINQALRRAAEEQRERLFRENQRQASPTISTSNRQENRQSQTPVSEQRGQAKREQQLQNAKNKWKALSQIDNRQIVNRNINQNLNFRQQSQHERQPENVGRRENINPNRENINRNSSVTRQESPSAKGRSEQQNINNYLPRFPTVYGRASLINPSQVNINPDLPVPPSPAASSDFKVSPDYKNPTSPGKGIRRR